MMLRHTFAVLLTFATVALGATAANAAPRELYGKSIVVTWTEERVQEIKGSFKPALRNGTFTVYVSTAGNIFKRNTMGRNSDERVGSEAHDRVSFAGRTLIVIQNWSQYGARRIQVIFDQGFTSCSADVVRGKETGAAVIQGSHGAIIQSVKTTGVSCSLRDGNVFAGG